MLLEDKLDIAAERFDVDYETLEVYQSRTGVEKRPNLRKSKAEIQFFIGDTSVAVTRGHLVFWKLSGGYDIETMCLMHIDRDVRNDRPDNLCLMLRDGLSPKQHNTEIDPQILKEFEDVSDLH